MTKVKKKYQSSLIVAVLFVGFLKDFLNDRTQKVVTNNTLSESLPIFSKVPQEGFFLPATV